MNILKKWFWQWLDKNKHQLLGDYTREVIREQFGGEDKINTIRKWVESEAVNSVSYTHFVSAVADNSHLIDAIVKSINDKQIRRSL
jgi:hypothetical protein